MRRGPGLTLLAGMVLPALLPAQADVSPAEIRRVLARYDEAFNHRDLEGCMALFEGENPDVLAALRERLASVFSMPRRLVQDSVVEGELQHVGPRIVARVRHARSPSGNARTTKTVTEWCYFVFKAEDGRVTPVTAVELDNAMLGHVQDGRFSCPPCNYSIGGIEGWLPVPLPSERTNVMEAVSFLLMGSDLTFDLSVHIEPEPERAGDALERLVADLRAAVPGLRAGAIEDWAPPSIPAAAEKGMEGSRVRLGFEDGTEHWIHLCTMGVMRYLIVARGSSETLRRNADGIEAMLSSFVLKDPEISEDRLAEYPLFRHTGGRFVDGRYVNVFHQIEFSGPESWKPGQRSGAFLFQALYTCPDTGTKLWITGHENPAAGLEARMEYADRLLAEICRADGLILARDGDGEWEDPRRENGFHTRTVKVVAREGVDRQPCLLRLAIRGDLLVVLTGRAGNARLEKLVRNAFDSLRSR